MTLSAQLAPVTKQQFFDLAGVPLASGQVYTYAAGTLTPQATYTDGTGTATNTNPVLLDAAGRANIWLSLNGLYKFVVQDSLGNTIYTTDNITVANIGSIVTTAAPLIQVQDSANDAIIISRVTQSQNPVTIRTSNDLSDLRLQAGITPALETSIDLTANNGTGSASSIILKTVGTNFFELDNNGNIGLNGAASSAWAGPGNIQSNNFVWSGWDQSLGYNYQYTAGGYEAIISDYACKYAPFSGYHLWYTSPSALAGAAQTVNEVMRLDRSGNLLVGQTSAGAIDKNSFSLSLTGGLSENHATGTANGTVYETFNYAGSQIGSITQNATTNIGITGVGKLTFADGTFITSNPSATAIAGFRNRLMNGNMNIYQRGSSGTSNSGSTNVSLDRWWIQAGGAATTWSYNVIASPPWGAGYGTFLKITGAAGNTVTALFQRIESQNIRDLTNQNVTLSYWVYQTTGSALSLTPALANPTAMDTWTSQTNIVGTGVSIPNATWTKVVQTFAIPNTTASAYGLAVYPLGVQGSGTPALGAGQLIQVAQVQLELGSSATNFEVRPYGIELGLCQRYYQTSYPYGLAPGTASAPLDFQAYALNTTDFYLGRENTIKLAVPMYALSLYIYNPSTGTYSSMYDYTSSTSVLAGYIGGSSSGYIGVYNGGGASFTANHLYGFHWVVDGEIR